MDIKQLLKDLRLTQSRLSQLTGIKQSTISNAVTGKTRSIRPGNLLIFKLLYYKIITVKDLRELKKMEGK